MIITFSAIESYIIFTATEIDIGITTSDIVLTMVATERIIAITSTELVPFGTNIYYGYLTEHYGTDIIDYGYVEHTYVEGEITIE